MQARPLAIRIALLLLAGSLAAAPEHSATMTKPADVDSHLDADSDPYLWLEEIEGKRAMQWVKARNRATERTLANRPRVRQLRQRLLTVFDSEDRIPDIDKLGDHYYNFWRDKTNPRGIWRRTSLAEYAKAAPAWETVLDLDELARKERENWTLGEFHCRQPDYRRCLVRLSRGGADAAVTREFDMVEKRFVDAGAGGFVLPEAKSNVGWAGADSLFVATDFGAGSLTDSGYPRIVKLWRRGQPLDQAPIVFEGEPADVSVGAYADLAEGFELHTVWRATDFYNSEMFVRPALPGTSELTKLDKPADATAATHRGRLFLELKSDWTVGERTFMAGSLLAIDLEDFLAGGRDLAVLFEPEPGVSLAGFAPTRNHVLVTTLDNVKNRIFVATPTPEGWRKRPLLPAMEGFRTLYAAPVDPDADDRYFLDATDYLTPPTLALAAVGETPRVLKEAPAYFDTAGLAISQHWATSADGTRIPYFQVARAQGVENSAKPQPTLLYGYGGFETSLLPRYSAGVGIAWLERGGTYVVANIRGGGEFGPAWHRAALRENRQRAFDDFVAVAEHLLARGVTTSAQLGILGGSNGGLLMGNMLTMRPDLFGAIAAQVPLFDMRRYHRLLAGASWMAEYGDPDDADDWRFLQRFSPYHNLQPAANYPPLLVTTSTRDDRVHPGHARKMVAKMRQMGFDVTYFENVEGGHGGAADNAQSAFMWALVYEFLWRELGGDGNAET